jgi:hypothetical protein
VSAVRFRPPPPGIFGGRLMRAAPFFFGEYYRHGLRRVMGKKKVYPGTGAWI